MMSKKPLPVADDEVVFLFGNIVSINIDEANPHEISINLVTNSNYSLTDLAATNFLRNFPREYFEGAPDLLRLYDAIWMPEKLPY